MTEVCLSLAAPFFASSDCPHWLTLFKCYDKQTEVLPISLKIKFTCAKYRNYQFLNQCKDVPRLSHGCKHRGCLLL